jgi:hypothetical protein
MRGDGFDPSIDACMHIFGHQQPHAAWCQHSTCCDLQIVAVGIHACIKEAIDLQLAAQSNGSCMLPHIMGESMSTNTRGSQQVRAWCTHAAITMPSQQKRICSREQHHSSFPVQRTHLGRLPAMSLFPAWTEQNANCFHSGSLPAETYLLQFQLRHPQESAPCKVSLASLLCRPWWKLQLP